MTSGRRTLVVAGLSVRAAAESARRGGWDVIALDLFGDTDTRRASIDWAGIGDPASLRIDPRRLCQALERAARHPRVDGWVPAGGFEGAPALLALGARDLPCLAIAPPAMARVRDPATFFGVLDRHGLAHPAVSLSPPADAAGWLAKRAGGCGGLHIRPAAQSTGRRADTYFQRRHPGTPMSALFVADGARARVIALNRLCVRAQGTRPFVYAGAVGPVTDSRLEHAVARALAILVPEFELRGLASLDFLADAAGAHWLEVNPRPSATLQLHDGAWLGGLLRAHVDAVQGRLPAAAPQHGTMLRGHRTVFAARAGTRIEAPAMAPADRAHLHDLPAAGTAFAPGEPICTVSAEGPTLDATERLLDERAARVRRALVRPAHREEELAS